MPEARAGARYDRIGIGYAQRRRTDPTWMREIEAGLGDATTVLNVGAGTGSYEPVDRQVIALEPSQVMLAQRRAGAAPAVRGIAETLPFGDNSFDVGLGVLTVHHWTDQRAGLRELRRVSRRQLVTSYDPEAEFGTWLTDYFPSILGSELDSRALRIGQVAEELDVREIRPMWVAADCAEGFLCANWARPERYLDAGVVASISLFALMDPDEVSAGQRRLAADLESGRWHEKHGQDLTSTRDFGYRLVIAGEPL